MRDELRPDIEAAKQRMQARIGSRREVRALATHLWEGETVELMTTGLYGGGNGLLVLTDRRLLFVLDGLIRKATEDFPLDKVSSVSLTSGMMFATVAIFTGGNKAEVQQVGKKDAKAIVDAARGRLSQRGEAPRSPAAGQPAANDLVVKLRDLAALRDEGVISPEDFEAKKADLIRRL